MLRLLQSGECRNLGEAARALGYSWRQCQRWFAAYNKGGLEELLKSRVGERSRQELVTPEALEEMEEAMKRGEIATIRRATDRDGEVLTSMVRGASAYAGEYRKIVRDVLISPERIRRDHVYLCELDGEVTGFYALVSDEGGAELDFMFVVDEAQGLGIGRLLFGHMKAAARTLGHGTVLIVAHPPAEPFYAKMGAVTVDRKPPSGRVMWSRPRMRLELF